MGKKIFVDHGCSRRMEMCLEHYGEYISVKLGGSLLPLVAQSLENTEDKVLLTLKRSIKKNKKRTIDQIFDIIDSGDCIRNHF
jgi:hypothetical protein